MDRETSKNILRAVLKEYPDLMNEYSEKSSLDKSGKTVVTTIRITESMKNRVEKLTRELKTNHLDYKGNKPSRSDIIREALERGIENLEKLL